MMAADLSEPVTLAEIAEACGTSVGHFVRAFRQSTGISPHQWLLQQRVERAKLLLQTDQAGLAHIAVATGFADQSHFTRVFSQQTGMPPGVWKRLHAPSPGGDAHR